MTAVCELVYQLQFTGHARMIPFRFLPGSNLGSYNILDRVVFCILYGLTKQNSSSGGLGAAQMAV